jgi:serine-type D-Ala-D-Ala carboxypeptidase (penicillin-binding protein 5/6)
VPRRALALAVAVVGWLGATAAGAQVAVPGAAPPPGSPPPPAAAAWALVDMDTGAVLDGADLRTPRPPASTVKLLTAVIALEQLDHSAGVPVSPLAESMPARKMNMKAGQTWTFKDTLHALLIVSANDAAVALAEAVGGGTLDGWEPVAARTAAHLGMEDSPRILDPAGLDDEFSHEGGSLISARDLAIAARAAWARPEVRAIAPKPTYEFAPGGDGLPHRLVNHNRFLDLYLGANGLKTGYTSRAGYCLVATATRGGRTMLVVELDAPDPYAFAGWAMDRGFATPVADQAGLDHLPDVVAGASELAPPTTTPAAAPRAPTVGAPAAAAAASGRGSHWWDSPAGTVAILVVGGGPALLVLRRRAVAAAAAAET